MEAQPLARPKQARTAIARDCARQNGDFWVVYMGNNEVVGPYGSGTVFGSPAASLAVVRSSVALKSTRLAQMLEAVARDVKKRPAGQSDWGGMTMFLGNHVRQDDPRMATIYTNFEQNLKDIISAGLRGGLLASFDISTPGETRKDSGPSDASRPALSCLLAGTFGCMAKLAVIASWTSLVSGQRAMQRSRAFCSGWSVGINGRAFISRLSLTLSFKC